MQERNEVRRLYHIEGKSLRAIARETGFHRDTIKRIVAEGGPPEYSRKTKLKRPVLGPFIGIIDEILKQDSNAPPKQRHTAQRIFERLRDEYEYRGGYTQVRAYVRQARAIRREAFVPLQFGPAQAQVDWGEAVAYDDTREPPENSSVHTRKVYVFVMTLPYSDARFVAAFPRQTQEFFFEGHRRAFEFFGGVPRRVVYDNLRSAVTKVLRGRGRHLNKTFQQFCEHYLFEPSFCNVARGNEKGHVENGVKWTQRKLFVPPLRFSDWDDLNARLADGCRKLWDHQVRGQDRTIGERFEEERHHLTQLPGQPDAQKPLKPHTVSSLCLVRFQTNDYSTPCQYAHHNVAVRPTVGRVRIYHDDHLIAAHKRSYGRFQAIYEPWHYLALIERKPRALDDGAPMKRLQLDPCFDVLRRRLEAGQIHSRGTREYIRVLRLLEHHSPADLTRAVQRALAMGVDRYEAVKSLLLCPPERTPSPLDLTGRNWLAAFRFVPAPLAPYSALVGQGGGV